MRTLSRGVLGTFFLVLFATALFVVPANAQAAEWHIQDNATGGDCSLIGTWDTQTKTCTLSQNLSQGIIIDSDGVTLNGSGFTITSTSNSGAGVSLSSRTGVTIKNLNVNGLQYGIYLNSSGNNTLTGNTANSNDDVTTGISPYGIYLTESSNNTLTGNTTSGNSNSYGIVLSFSSNNTLIDNTASDNPNSYGIVLYSSINNTLMSNTTSGNSQGIGLEFSGGNVLTNNTSSANGGGIQLFHSDNNTLTSNAISANRSGGISLYSSSENSLIGNTASINSFNGSGYGIALNTFSNSNQIYNNSVFSNYYTQIFVSVDSSGNVLNRPSPTGGNYWGDFDTPDEGCSDVNDDSFCDAPYTFTGGQDNLPWTVQDGWLSGQQTATLTVIKMVVNNNGGTKVASDFTIAVSGANVSPATFQGAETGTVVSVAPGIYSVSETLVAGYTGSFGVDCSGTIASGEAKTCIITNDDVEASEQPFEQIQSELNQLSCLRDSGQARSIVVITHGWRDSATGWVQKMASDINSALPDDTDWNVCTYDWHVAADTPILSPSLAYSNAANEGEHLVQILLGGNYGEIHLIAHSAGSNLIQTAAKKVVEANPLLPPKIHLTFLDAYHPHGSLLQYGLDYRNIGTYTFRPDWWAEQYVDMRGAPILNDTNLILENAYNFIVDQLDTPKELEEEELQTVCVSIGCTLSDAAQRAYDAYASLHSFPHEWYDLSTIAPLPKYGFSLSAESGLNNHPLLLLFKGNSCTLTAGILNDSTGCETRLSQTKYEATYGETIHIQDLLANNLVEQSTTGSHEYPTPTSVLERTGSPVWFKIPVATAQDESILQFKYEYLSALGSAGILTVMLDEDPIYTIDERVAKPGLNTADNIIIGVIEPGTHSLKFRLDPFTDVQSVVKISDIQIGTLIAEEIVDSLPPTTSATASGTLWKNGWYVGTTTVTFTAEDNPGGVGVEKTEYSIDGGQTWSNYTQVLTISAEGATTVSYRSVDFFGNTETPKDLSIQIVSVKWFLEDALLKLKSIHTGNKTIDNTTASIIKDLDKDIADKSWIDRNRLLWPSGLPVLVNEVGIVKTLGRLIDTAGKDNLPTGTQSLYQDAQAEIVQSSALLAKLSFDKARLVRAKTAAGQKALDMLVARIQKMQDRAVENESNNPSKAEQLYGAVWSSSETLLKAFDTVPILSSDLGGLYDPSTMTDIAFIKGDGAML